ncbi:MAG TPA: hypothetical protein VHO95_13400, partial [Candidatus Dormibacteraeota bacterium]|nr:hypothetical protein [Candidatus Dormibacteraeota bacterium]
MRTLLVAACLGGAALAVTSSPVSASHAVVPAASSEAAHGRLGVTAHWTGLSPDQLHWPAVPKGNGPLFLGRGQNAGSAPVSPAPMVATAAPASPMTTFFNNLHQPGIAANGSTPPDSTGAVGPNNYVEMANSIIQVWGRDLTTNVASASFSTFANFTDPWCDPQVQWDQGANRWLAMFTLCNTTSQVEGFFLFWSKTSDPSDLVNGWCKIGFSTNPTLVDFPKLGHNSTYIDFGANVYDETTPSSNPPFLGALIAFFALPANGVTTCPTSGTIFTSPVLKNGDGTPAFTPVPVNTMTNSGLDYVVSSYDVSGGGSANKLAVWHLDSSGVITQDPDVTVPFPFSRPSPAPELGSTNLISTSDGRLTQAIGDPVNGIWTQHTVAGGAGSMVAWYELTQSGGGLVLTQSGNISSGTDFIFNGAVSPSFNSQGAAVEYSRSSSTI